MDRRASAREREGPSGRWWPRLLPWALASVAVSVGAAWVFRNLRAALAGVVVVLLYAAWKRRTERRVRIAATIAAAVLLLGAFLIARHVAETARTRGSWSSDAPAERSGAR